MSFDIALSGIQAINEQLETVSNNIANAGTFGFKSSRANFSSVYAGARANGVEIGSITQSIGQSGSAVSTGDNLNAAIDGRGFFVGRDLQGGLSYSRVGIFETDSAGYLVDSNHRRVQGYGPAKGGTLGTMGDIQVPTGQIPAVATGRIDFVGNMSADWTVPAGALNPADSATYNMVRQSVVYDAAGTKHALSQYFVKLDATNVAVYYAFDGAAPAAAPGTTLVFGLDGKLSGGASATFTLPAIPGVATGSVTIDYSGTTRFAGAATATTNHNDGYPSGSFLRVELAADGSLVAKYSNDQPQVVGTVAIATFANEGALNPVSDTSWTANAGSGEPLYDAPGTGLSGKLSTGMVEGSNVDITAELVGLMTSQRNYQANSKVLSTESEMMQALMQAM